MRISDWSSDVCSSDLAWRSEVQGFAKLPHAVLDSDAFRALPDAGKVAILALCRNHNGANNGRIALTRTGAVDRKSVVWGKSVSVRVDLGGRRTIKKITKIKSRDNKTNQINKRT